MAYSWLQLKHNKNPDNFKVLWEKELATTFKEEQWTKACTLAHKSSITTKMQETSYKMLTHCYATPEKLKRWFFEYK